MSAENVENIGSKAKSHLVKIQKFLLEFDKDNNLSVAEKSIIEKIFKLISEFFNKPPDNFSEQDCLQLSLSHLEAVLHNIKLKMGVSVFLPLEGMNSLQRLIDESYAINFQHKIASDNRSQSNAFSPNLQADEQKERRIESKLSAQQKHLFVSHTENPALKNFLKSIWEYALENKKASKRIFVSYAWPIGNVHQEKWTKDFIKNLAKMLCLAGFQVYLDDIHSGPGMYLRQFMRKIHAMDHVLVINSKTMGIKLKLDASGVRYEAERIKECPQFKTQKDFIINILLNNAMYSDTDFHGSPYISFFEGGYMAALKCLIGQLYGFEAKLFDNYWREQIKSNYVDSKLWNLKPLIPVFVPRTELTQSLKLLLKNHAKFICYGDKGSGKTELIKYYIHEKYRDYEAVFWFNASSENSLIQGYLDLAEEEGIDISTVDLGQKLVSALKIKEALENEWSKNQSNILIVLDDVVSYEAIENLIPTKNCKIIITSANPDIQTENDGSFVFFQIAGFTLKEIYAYMEKVIGNKKIEQTEQEDMTKFIAEFGINPLKLARACGYIQRNRKSVKYFLESYPKMGDSLLLQNLLPTRIAQAQSLTEAPLQKPDEASQDLQLSIPDDIKAFLDELKIKFANIIEEYGLSISEEIKIMMMAIIEHPLLTRPDYFYCLISHLEAVLPYLKKYSDLTGLLEKGYGLLQKYPKPATDLSINTQTAAEEKVTQPCIAVNQKDDPDEEQKRSQEQNKLNEPKAYNGHYLNTFQLFLHDIWKYALGSSKDRAYTSKKIHIVFEVADVIQIRDEWVYAYVETLKNHLIYAGFTVFPEDLLNPNNIISSDIDHVLVISHKAKVNDLRLSKQIEQHPNFKSSPKRFVIPILLNNINYLSKEYKEIAELSFYKTSYINALRDLIRTLYHFDHDKFNIYWKQKLIYRKIKNNTWNTPPKTKHFVGRRELLKNIHTRLDDRRDANKPLVLTAFSGMGGVGKTQLALQFIHLHGHEYEHIYWIDAESEESIIFSYIKLGKMKGLFHENEKIPLKDKAYLVKDWLENTSPQGWLLIYDNADKSSNESFQKLIPVKNGKVLITSRHTQWEDCIPVDVFSREESIEYITEILGQKIIEEEYENAKQLAKVMKNLPLALAHACAYIKYNNTTIDDYLTLNTIKMLSLELDMSDIFKETYNPVTLTWNITLKKIKKESPEALELLYCCAYFHHNAIPECLLKELFSQKTKDSSILAKTEPVDLYDEAQAVGLKNIFNFSNEETQFSHENESEEYVRQKIPGDKDYGYMALGISREQAYYAIMQYLDRCNPNYFLDFTANEQKAKVNRLLDAIGKTENDSYSVSEDIKITRGKIGCSITDGDNHYTEDYINLLLYYFNQNNIKVYPANSVEALLEYSQQIQEQKKQYAFIPLHVPYDERIQCNIHWAALVIDKKNKLIFYLDPAQKLSMNVLEKTYKLKDFLGYEKHIIFNPIDFQQSEKNQGWIRHSGAYIIEIFKRFANTKECVSGGQLADPTIPDSIALQTLLSSISCGDAEDVESIRQAHIEEACKFIVSNSSENYSSHVQEKKDSIIELLNPAVKWALLDTEEFLKYLHQNNYIGSNIDSSIIEEKIEEFSHDLNIIKAYITYDIKDEEMGSSDISFCIMHAIAHIYRIELLIFRLGNKDNLEKDQYASYIPEKNISKHIYLLFTKENHFEILIFKKKRLSNNNFLKNHSKNNSNEKSDYLAFAIMENKCANAIRVVEEYSMVSFNDEDNSISLHLLIQEIIKNSIKRSDYFAQSVFALSNIFPHNEHLVSILLNIKFHLEQIRNNFPNHQDYFFDFEKINEQLSGLYNSTISVLLMNNFQGSLISLVEVSEKIYAHNKGSLKNHFTDNKDQYEKASGNFKNNLNLIPDMAQNIFPGLKKIISADPLSSELDLIWKSFYKFIAIFTNPEKLYRWNKYTITSPMKLFESAEFIEVFTNISNVLSQFNKPMLDISVFQLELKKHRNLNSIHKIKFETKLSLLFYEKTITISKPSSEDYLTLIDKIIDVYSDFGDIKKKINILNRAYHFSLKYFGKSDYATSELETGLESARDSLKLLQEEMSNLLCDMPYFKEDTLDIISLKSNLIDLHEYFRVVHIKTVKICLELGMAYVHNKEPEKAILFLRYALAFFTPEITDFDFDQTDSLNKVAINFLEKIGKFFPATFSPLFLQEIYPIFGKPKSDDKKKTNKNPDRSIARDYLERALQAKREGQSSNALQHPEKFNEIIPSASDVIEKNSNVINSYKPRFFIDKIRTTEEIILSAFINKALLENDQLLPHLKLPVKLAYIILDIIIKNNPAAEISEKIVKNNILLENVLDFQVKYFGRHHPKVGRTCLKLAFQYALSQESRKAKHYLDYALQICINSNQKIQFEFINDLDKIKSSLDQSDQELLNAIEVSLVSDKSIDDCKTQLFASKYI